MFCGSTAIKYFTVELCSEPFKNTLMKKYEEKLFK